MSAQIPLVDYLVLGDTPHLVAHECTACGARFFDRRNACANCSKTDFRSVDIPTEGVLRTFTIVTFAAPGIAGVFECGGTSVRANIVNCAPTPEAVSLGMKVKLVTVPVGTDEAGTEAVGFGFEPA